MLNPAKIPNVTADELLARFIYSSRHIAKGEAKQDAFIPYPHPDLSMTRHLHATQDEIWNEGQRIATLREKTFYGRADLTAKAFLDRALPVNPVPDLPANPNHVVAVGWPVEKSEQKLIALELAAQSKFIATPPA